MPTTPPPPTVAPPPTVQPPPTASPVDAPTSEVLFDETLATCSSFSGLDASYQWCWIEDGERLINRIVVGNADLDVGWAVASSALIMNDADGVVTLGDDVGRWNFAARNIGTRLQDDGLEDEAVIRSNGQTTILFTRRFDDEGNDDKRALSREGDNRIIIAIAGDLRVGSGGHSGSNRLQLRVDLQTGDFSVEDDTPDEVLYHAVFMSLAWMFFAPLGILASLYRAFLPEKGIWFKVHVAAMIMTLVCNLVGFFIILDYLDTELILDDDRHKTLGFVVFIAANAQALGGALRPHHEEQKSKSVSRRLFEVFHPMLGLVLVILAHYNAIRGFDYAVVRFLSPGRKVKDGEDFEIVPLILLIVFLVLAAPRWVYNTWHKMAYYGEPKYHPKVAKGESKESSGESA
eukprot:scaffold2069_cov254-Pinguiococcus_pyrenoidosus.AAC.10